MSPGPCIFINSLLAKHSIYVNHHTQLQTKVTLFLLLSVPDEVTKVAWFQNTIRDFSSSKKYVLLHYNVVSRTCFHLYYFYNVSPSKISNHNAFCNFLLGYNALRTLDKMDRNRLLEDNTSLEAVTLIEESDNEVFKLLNYEYI